MTKCFSASSLAAKQCNEDITWLYVIFSLCFVICCPHPFLLLRTRFTWFSIENRFWLLCYLLFHNRWRKRKRRRRRRKVKRLKRFCRRFLFFLLFIFCYSSFSSSFSSVRDVCIGTNTTTTSFIVSVLNSDGTTPSVQTMGSIVSPPPRSSRSLTTWTTHSSTTIDDDRAHSSSSDFDLSIVCILQLRVELKRETNVDSYWLYV